MVIKMFAFVREVSPRLDRCCESAFRPRRPVKAERARRQHEAYGAVLAKLGVTVNRLAGSSDQPGSAFVEDAAILLPEVGVIARTGVALRAAEVETLAPVLAQYGPIQRLADHGHIEGGDVLRVGRTLYVGRSPRTNEDGVAGLREIVEVFDYEVRTVETKGGIRLKSACTFIPPHFLIANPVWVNPGAFGHLVALTADDSEPFGANTLTIGTTTLVSASCPKTEERLNRAGVTTQALDISEFEKLDGGLTSLSLILEPRASKAAIRDPGIRTIQLPEIPAPPGHSSQALVHGGLVYVSPQFPPGADGLEPWPIEKQTEEALRNLAAILASAGSSLPRVLRVTLYLTDPKHLDRIESIYTRVFEGHRPPRTVLANRALPPGILLGIEVVAAVAEP